MGIPMVRRMVRSLLRALGVAEECASDILIATSEACTNAVRHGDPATRYEVTARIHDERCELHVAVEDPQHLQRFLVHKLAPPTEVRHFTTSIVLEKIRTRALSPPKHLRPKRRRRS